MGSLTSTITDRTQAEFGLAYVAGDPRIVHVFEVKGYDIDGATETTLYWSDVGFTSGTGDTPANTHMEARLIPPQFSASLLGPEIDGGEHRGLPGLRNFAPPEFNIVRLINTDIDPDTGIGDLDEYADRDSWSFAGREAYIKVGADDLAYTSFETIMGGAFRILGEPLWSAQGDLTFVLSPPLEGYNEPFQDHQYGGFGASLDFDGSTTYINYGNEWNIGQLPTCLEWRISFPDNANQRNIQQKRATASGATDNGYSLWINTSKQLMFDVSDGTNDGVINLGSASAYDDEEKRMFSVNIDWDNNEIEAFVSHYVAGVQTTTSLGTLDITGWGAIYNALDNIGGAGAGGSGAFFDGELDEFRVWRKVRTSAEIKAQAFRTASGSENRLVACYKFDDRSSSSTAWQNVVVPGLVSLEYSGATHQISYGNVLNQGSSDSFTMGIWVKLDNTGTVDYIMGNRDTHAAGNAGYSILCNGSGSDEFIAYMDDGTTRKSASSSGNGYAYGVWHFVFLRADRSGETLECGVLEHRDAEVEVGSSTDTTGLGSLSNSNDLVVGRKSTGGNPITGRTGHHFFVTQALTNAEIASLARYMWDLDTISMPKNGLSVESTASSFWNQDEGSLNAVADSWGSRNGTITGAAWTTQDATLNGTVAFVSSLDGDAGTGERSNEQNVQGLRVPHCWGRATGVRMVLIDSADDGVSTATPIYQFADPLQGGTKAIENLYSGGLVLTGGGSDYNAPDYTNNTVELTAPQNEVITGDIKGYVDGSSDLIDRTGAISAEVFTLIGETSQNSASFTAIDTDYPYVVSLVTDTDEHLTEEVVNAMLRPSCWGTKNISGEIEVGVFKNLDGEAADLDLTTSNVREDGLEIVASSPPASGIELGFRRNWTPLTSFLGGVQTPEQIRQSQQYQVAMAPVWGVSKTENKDAKPIRPTSHIQYTRDAKKEAERLAGIFDRPLMILRVLLSADIYKAEIGDVVNLTYPRFGFGSGKNFMCIGYTYPNDPSLLLWGPFTPEA